MSASLVGSEMCIRDSLQSRPGVGAVLRAKLRVRSNSGHREAAPQVALSAVSYTHLTLPTICSV
eukprot:4955385-Alexandrium_andersonii.AAC.1